jgi:hypothetical protein
MYVRWHLACPQPTQGAPKKKKKKGSRSVAFACCFSFLEAPDNRQLALSIFIGHGWVLYKRLHTEIETPIWLNTACLFMGVLLHLVAHY